MMTNELNPRVLLLLLSAVGLITLPHIGHIPWPLSVLFFSAWGWRLCGVWRPRTLPNAKVIFVLTLGSIGLLFSLHTGVWGRDAGTAIFVTALGLKLLEIHKKRDVYLVGYLVFIVAASQFLYQQTMAMAAYSLLVCCVLLATLVAINSEQPQNKTALRTAALLMLQALPLAAIIFVVFPRMQAPTWMLPMSDKNKALSGLGDTLEPGSISQLALSPELAFRVKFNGKPPPKNQLYWRGPVFSYTDGTVWSMAKNNADSAKQHQLHFSGTAYQYSLLQEPQRHHWVYALDMPAQFDASVQRLRNYQLTSRTKVGEAAEYALVSYTQYNTGDIGPAESRENRQLPGAPSPRIIELVKQLQGFEKKPELFIQQLLGYFRQQPFSYSLQPPLMENKPIETFLFDVRSGFCSHYATAFVYLMRVADIPARVVSGYQGGEFNAVGQFLEVRQANAHAWAEVWLQGRGWVRVDPTAAIAPERIEQDINLQGQIETGGVSLIMFDADWQGRGLYQIKKFWNNVDYQWQRRIVNFGSDHQNLLISALGIGSLLERVLWIFAAIGVVTLLLAAWLLRVRYRADDPAVILYRQFCQKMAKAGVPIRLGEGANDFAERIRAQKPEFAERVDEITRLFVRLRYQRAPAEDDLTQLKNRVKGLAVWLK
ncbi:MAG: transglutaminase TgpA family protein [Methylobacter sp.]